MSEGSGMDAGAWREGLSVLRQRIEDLPASLRSFDWGTRGLAVDSKGVRRFVVTGIGSSAGHARYLAELLSRYLGLSAAFVSIGQLAGLPRQRCQDDVLIVFSQGLSPNARFALTAPESWGEVVLFCALKSKAAGETSASDRESRFDFLKEVEAAGVRVMRFLDEDEYGSLVRVSGPLLGYAAALDFAQGVAAMQSVPSALPAWDVDAVLSRMGDAERRAEEDFGSGTLRESGLDGRLTLLSAGGYGEMIQNLRTKVQEGLRLPFPPLYDALEFAHGGFQEIAADEAVILALTAADCDDEGIARAARMLDGDRHRLMRLRSPLPSPLAVFEHEAYFNRLLTRWVEEQRQDPAQWPGKGMDAALYEWGPSDLSSATPPAGVDRESNLAAMTWPDVERRIGNAQRTAVLPLGSTEQHGAHLPLSTDNLIAKALAERFCARVDEAVALPVVEVGVAPEHMDFAGTLSIRESTLQAIVCDWLDSIARHGFSSAFVFSAHGGNVGPLERMAAALVDAGEGLSVCVFDGWAEVVARCQAVALGHGVSVEAAGHHGGEIETSIVAAIRPAMVRRRNFEPGFMVGPEQAESVFRPGLRKRVPGGVVGDPGPACASRGQAYLDCWTDALVEAYVGAKKRNQMIGMKKE